MTVVVIWRHSGVTAGAGVAFEHRWAWVVRVREGKAAHIRAYFDPDKALRAAGRGPASALADAGLDPEGGDV